MNFASILRVGSYFVKAMRYELLSDIMTGRYSHWLVDYERGGMTGLVECYFAYENETFATIQEQIESSCDEDMTDILDREVRSVCHHIADDKDFEMLIKKLADGIRSDER